MLTPNSVTQAGWSVVQTGSAPCVHAQLSGCMCTVGVPAAYSHSYSQLVTHHIV